MPISATNYITNSDMSKISESRVLADQPAPLSPIQAAAFSRSNLLFPPVGISGIYISVRQRKAADMKSQFMIGEPDVWNSPQLSDRHLASARYLKLVNTWNMLENLTATRQQSSNKELCRLDIARVRLVNNHRIMSAFVANQRSPFQVPASVPCDQFGLANSSKAWFVNNVGKFLSSRETPSANPAITDVVEMWGARTSRYNNDAFVRN